MPRIFKGSESTLKLLVGKTNEVYDNLRILLYTTNIDDAIEVIDGITLDGNIAELNLASRAFLGLEDGLIRYKVEYVIDGDLFQTERESNYYLKSLSYISENGAKQQILNITENGEYKITPNDGAYVTIRVDVVGYEQGLTEGYNQGWADGYVSGESEGYGQGHSDGYDQGHSDGSNDGIEVGKAQIVEEAIVLDITENGTYYTQYADIPEWNEPLTGDDFYSYAVLRDIAFDTGIPINEITSFEFWWKYDDIHNEGYIIGYGYNALWMRISNIEAQELVINFNGSSTYYTLTKDEWHHFKYDRRFLYIDDNEVTYHTTTFNSSRNLSLNGQLTTTGSDGASGYWGMLKVNDKIFIPDAYGIKEITTGGYAKENFYDTTKYLNYKYEYRKVERPVEQTNLIKEVRVDSKIDFVKSGFKAFEGDSFWGDSIPDYFDYSNVKYISNLLAYNATIKDITPLSAITKVLYMKSAFSSSNVTDISPIANWDVSECTEFYGAFANSQIQDYTPIANWDTSNATNMSGFIQRNTPKLTIPYIVPALRCDSVNTGSYGIMRFNTDMTNFVDFGGFINLKYSQTHTDGLCKCPALSYESCMNVVNGLYDFTGNGETPTSSQGQLKVHQNFLDNIGEDGLALATSKGWVLTV